MSQIGFLAKTDKNIKEQEVKPIHPAFDDIFARYTPQKNEGQIHLFSTDQIIEILNNVCHSPVSTIELYNKLKDLGYNIQHTPGTSTSSWVLYEVL